MIMISLIQLGGLLANYEQYRSYFQFLAERLLTLRYLISLLGRIATSIMGILYRNDFLRRLAIMNSWLIILILYWKHPYPVIYAHVQAISRNFEPLMRGLHATDSFIPTVTLGVLIVIYLSDLLFNGWVIYYLTRPRVKAQFQPA